MAANVTNLIQGPANLYAGAFGATEPADADINASYAGTAFSEGSRERLGDVFR